MSKSQVYSDGALIEEWDDGTRTYTRWDDTGAVVETRPYTPEENADADARTQADTESANADEVTSDLDQALIDLQAVIDSDNSTINQNPAGEIKDTARVVKKIIRKLNERFEDTE